MKRIIPLIYCLIGLCATIHAQVSYCPNLSFELGDFSNWEGYNWTQNSVGSDTMIISPRIKVDLPKYRRQEIIYDKKAKDPNTGNVLSKIPPGYKFSARLDDEIFKPEDNRQRKSYQNLRYTMTVDSSNSLLILKYAVVLEYPDDNQHSDKEEPRFKLTFYDKNNNVIEDCANLNVCASTSVNVGFQVYEHLVPEGFVYINLRVFWKDWTTVGVDLRKFIGEQITIEFLTGDCSYGKHAGYAYFLAECRPMNIVVKYCAGDSFAYLKAPEGFEKYLWKDSRGVVVDSVQSLKLKDPVEGATYSCALTSITGCKVELQSTVDRYEYKTDFTSEMLDCKSNKVQLVNNSSHNRGEPVYNWDFGDGNSSSERNPQYTFATSGRHQVKLKLSNPLTSCIDTLVKTVESFSPPLVGIRGDSTWCPEGNSIWLKGYGAVEYTWKGGFKGDSVRTSPQEGRYWLVGHSSKGCVSDTVWKNVVEEPYWELLDLSTPIICEGSMAPVTLRVAGAESYLWDTGASSWSIKVNEPGIYTVTGTNKRGCKKAKNIEVRKDPLPDVRFKTSSNKVDIKHNVVEGSIVPQAGVSYSWNLGDGYLETGSTFRHRYNVDNTVYGYNVSLKATNQNGCTDHFDTTIDVVPFIPNVFSPNGDGINDLFIPGMDLQITDRHGLILYEGNEGWDGTYKGKIATADTYFYLIRYRDYHQQEQTRKGFVTLVR